MFTEEMSEVKNPAEKQMLLQKYGMIEPKLTDYERKFIKFEDHCHRSLGTKDINYTQLVDVVGRTS